MKTYRAACFTGLFATLLCACSTLPWSTQTDPEESNSLRSDVESIVTWTWFVRGAQPAELDTAFEELRAAPVSRLNSARRAIVRSRPGFAAHDPDAVQKLVDALGTGQTATPDDAVFAELLNFLSDSVTADMALEKRLAEQSQARERLQNEIAALKNELHVSRDVQATLRKKLDALKTLETRILETDGIVSRDSPDEK